MSKYIVLKFGGSSQCNTGVHTILKKLREYINPELNPYKFPNKIIFVISAVGKTTNNLYSIINYDFDKYNDIYQVHEKYCKEIGVEFDEIKTMLEDLKIEIEIYRSKPMIDTTQQKIKIISFGEHLASLIIHKFLELNSIRNKLLNSHQFIRNKSPSSNIDTDNLTIKGDFYCDKFILDIFLKDYAIFVTQGFIAITADYKYCILTRSGSNTSASLIASCVCAERLEIWTDVNGLYTADPRKNKDAKLIDHIQYNICQEAAAMGSQIVHPYSIKPCQEKNIPIYIKNTFHPDEIGTIINGSKISKFSYLISSQSDVTMFQIESLSMWDGYGFVSDIFSVFTEEKIDVNIITTSQFSISTTTNEKSVKKLENVLEKLSKKYKVIMTRNCNIVSIVGENILKNKLLNKCIDELDETIHMIHYGSNNMSLSYVVDETSSNKLIDMLHAKLIS